MLGPGGAGPNIALGLHGAVLCAQNRREENGREIRHFQGRKERSISSLKTLLVFADESFSSLIAEHAFATPSRKGTHPTRRASRLTLNKEKKRAPSNRVNRSV